MPRPERSMSRSGGMPEPSQPPPPPSAPAPMEEMAPASASASVAAAASYDAEGTTVAVSKSARSYRQSAPPAAALPLGPPGGYRPPSVASDSPAALAGGYDLSYPALRRETIPSGQGSRRVALLSKEWPVTVTRGSSPRSPRRPSWWRS